jgi:SAM-dependent methyltransferase
MQDQSFSTHPVNAELGSTKYTAEMKSAGHHSESKGSIRHPFGCEYAESSRWRSLERFYIRHFGFVDLPSRMRARLIKRTLRNLQWKTMLDFGSGTGAYSFFFSRSRDVRVWAVDIHRARIDDCLALCRKLDRKTLDFFCSSTIFETNRFHPDSMDVVLAIEVLQYMVDVRAGLREIFDVLKPGGHLIAHVPLLGYQRRAETILFDPRKFADFIQDAGFELISLNRIFGKTEQFLTGIYEFCGRSRFLTAIIFPLLLLASLPCGKSNSQGKYCIAVARKPICGQTTSSH